MVSVKKNVYCLICITENLVCFIQTTSIQIFKKSTNQSVEIDKILILTNNNKKIPIFKLKRTKYRVEKKTLANRKQTATAVIVESISVE